MYMNVHTHTHIIHTQHIQTYTTHTHTHAHTHTHTHTQNICMKNALITAAVKMYIKRETGYMILKPGPSNAMLYVGLYAADFLLP